MTSLFNAYLYQPFLAVFIFIYQHFALHDLGLAIILVTILVRLVLFPLFYRGAKNQTVLARLQPHIKKIQLDHKDNKEEQAKALMELYKENKINPFSGFVLILIQLPIFLALFQIFTKGLKTYAFDVNAFWGLINLSEKSLVIAVLAAVLQYVLGRISLPPQAGSGEKENAFASAGRMMVWMGPLFTLLVLTNLPSAIGIYWLVSNVFSVLQQLYINKKLPKIEHNKRHG
jgi:YidC/Oxa1 family membrane protein insertase